MNYNSGNFKKAVFGGFDKDDVFNFFSKCDEEHKKEVEELNGEIKKLKAELSAEKSSHAETGGALEALKIEKDELEEILAEKEEALKAETEALEASKKDIQNLRSFNSEVSMKKSVLENSITKLTGEKAELEKKLSDCITALQSAAEYRKNAEEELETLRAEKEDLQAVNVILTSEKAVLEAEKLELLTELNKKTPAERLGEEISNIVVEAKGLADRIVTKAYNKANNAETNLHEEQRGVKDTVHTAGEKLRDVAASYKAMAEDFVRQLEELCGRVDDTEHNLDHLDFFADASDEGDEIDAEFTLVEEKKAPVPTEDYSARILEVLQSEGTGK